jgi:hypothetical protein
MPCVIHGNAIVCGRGARPPKCRFCDRQSTKLCDFVTSHQQQVTHKKTCDAPMCDVHAKSVGPNLDYCPDHAKEKPCQSSLNLDQSL